MSPLGLQEQFWNQLAQNKTALAVITREKLTALLINSEIKSMELLPETTASEVYKVALEGGQLAIWKPVPSAWKFRDPQHAVNFNHFREVVTYKIAVALGLSNIPVTIVRTVDGVSGSLQAFVKKDGTTYKDSSLHSLKIVDWFVGQFDRAPLCEGNCFAYQGQAVGIDNGFFHLIKSEEKIKFLQDIPLTRKDQDLIEKLEKVLTKKTLTKMTQGFLNQADCDHLQESRDLLLAHLKSERSKRVKPSTK